MTGERSCQKNKERKNVSSFSCLKLECLMHRTEMCGLRSVSPRIQIRRIFCGRRRIRILFR